MYSLTTAFIEYNIKNNYTFNFGKKNYYTENVKIKKNIIKNYQNNIVMWENDDRNLNGLI